MITETLISKNVFINIILPLYLDAQKEEYVFIASLCNKHVNSFVATLHITR